MSPSLRLPKAIKLRRQGPAFVFVGNKHLQCLFSSSASMFVLAPGRPFSGGHSCLHLADQSDEKIEEHQQQIWLHDELAKYMVTPTRNSPHQLANATMNIALQVGQKGCSYYFDHKKHSYFNSNPNVHWNVICGKI